MWVFETIVILVAIATSIVYGVMRSKVSVIIRRKLTLSSSLRLQLTEPIQCDVDSRDPGGFEEAYN